MACACCAACLRLLRGQLRLLRLLFRVLARLLRGRLVFRLDLANGDDARVFSRLHRFTREGDGLLAIVLVHVQILRILSAVLAVVMVSAAYLSAPAALAI
jgi:hypothetical protein